MNNNSIFVDKHDFEYEVFGEKRLGKTAIEVKKSKMNQMTIKRKGYINYTHTQLVKTNVL